jgi:hypothetical protein
MIKNDFSGPLDETVWPSKLTARVVSPGADVRLHGYSIESDLAANYTFSETVLIALTGSVPTAAQGRAFDVALTFFSGTHAAEAPVHAALLARVCAATTSAISGTGAIALAEQARFDLAKYAPLLAWLAEPLSSVPIAFRAKTSSEIARTRLLVDALSARDASVSPVLMAGLEPTAAIVAVLFDCGIRSLEHLETIRVLARYPLLMAEAIASPAAKHRDYPVTLPPIQYEEGVS